MNRCRCRKNYSARTPITLSDMHCNEYDLAYFILVLVLTFQSTPSLSYIWMSFLVVFP